VSRVERSVLGAILVDGRVYELHCIICTAEIPEKRARRNATTCSAKCRRALVWMQHEEARREMQGNTCLTCLRYIPYDAAATALRSELRFNGGLWHGNAARFA